MKPQSVFLLFGAALALVLALLTPNPELTVLGMGVLFLIPVLAFRKGYPAIFLFGLVMQWPQAFIRVLQANNAGLAIQDFDYSPNAFNAVLAALLAVLVLSVIFRIFLNNTPLRTSTLEAGLDQINVKKAFLLYVLFFLAYPLLNQIRLGGFSQIVYAIQSLKWVLYAVLFLSVIRQKSGYAFAIAAFFIEFLSGFTSYFSEFKTVIFYTSILYLSSIKKIALKPILLGLIGLVLVITLALFWTTIKSNVRAFARGEETAQVVTVSREEMLQYVFSQKVTLNEIYSEKSIDALLSRLQYTQMMQRVMDYVPSIQPHENGKLWLGALTHIFTPRILFPNKEALDDSEVTSKYTGIYWAGVAEGTSISIGYISESYVDFGYWGMFVPIVLLGIGIGFIYRYFLTRKSPFYLLDFVAVFPILIQFSRIETAANKLIGGILMFFLVYVFVVRLFIFPVFWRFISESKK